MYIGRLGSVNKPLRATRIRRTGWQPEVFATAREFCLARGHFFGAALFWNQISQALTVSICRLKTDERAANVLLVQQRVERLLARGHTS